MEEILAFLGFSAGASLTIGAIGALRRGLRSSAVGVTRRGLDVGDALRRAGNAARKIGDEARAELCAEPERPRRRRASARASKDVRTIEVATH
jgi:hypothetical protein